jgi:hypothetical protein
MPLWIKFEVLRTPIQSAADVGALQKKPGSTLSEAGPVAI